MNEPKQFSGLNWPCPLMASQWCHCFSASRFNQFKLVLILNQSINPTQLKTKTLTGDTGTDAWGPRLAGLVNVGHASGHQYTSGIVMFSSASATRSKSVAFLMSLSTADLYRLSGIWRGTAPSSSLLVLLRCVVFLLRVTFSCCRRWRHRLAWTHPERCKLPKTGNSWWFHSGNH